MLFGPVDSSISKYADIEKSIRWNIDTWLCNLYFSMELREPLANPYTTQLDLDGDQGHNVQVLELEDGGEDNNPNPSVDNPGGEHRYQPIDHPSSSVSLPFQEQRPDPEPVPQGNNERIAALLHEEGSDDEFDGQRTRKEYPPLLKPEDYDAYTFHIPHIELKTRAAFANKITYIVDEVLADLGFRNLMSVEFWFSVVILLITMWARAYIHPFGSWLYLKMASIPVTSFSTEWYGFTLEYPRSTVGNDIGAILIGNFFVTVVFLFLIFICWFLQRCIGGAPNIIYRIVAAFGISTVADFLLLAIVDLANDVSVSYVIPYRQKQARSGDCTTSTTNLTRAA